MQIRTLVLAALTAALPGAATAGNCLERRASAREGRAMCEARLIRAGLGGSEAYAACVSNRPAVTCRRDAARKMRKRAQPGPR
jgi:hypothetical protein